MFPRKLKIFGNGSDQESGSHREQDLSKQVETGSFIIDGKDQRSLIEGAHPFSFPLKANGVMATDQGMGKNPSEDAAVVVTSDNFAAVIDGVGGYFGGDKAARFLGNGFCLFPCDFEAAIEHAKAQMRRLNFEESLKLYGSSACFFSIRIALFNGKRHIHCGQSGDCRLMIFRKNGDLIESQDESYVNDLVQKKLLAADEALYHDLRNRITNAIKLAFENSVTVNPPLALNAICNQIKGPLEIHKGDRILLMSDGISDNLTAIEIREMIQGRTLNQAIDILDKATMKRMRQLDELRHTLIKSYLIKTESEVNEKNANRILEKIHDDLSPYQWLSRAIFQKARKYFGAFPDGYKSKPSRDNRSLIIIDIL